MNDPKPTREATLRDIAAAAGVHQTTASRALDPARRHRVSADSARRVDAAASALGYRLNRAASALRTGRSGVVGVLVPDITNPVFPPMLRGIEHALAAHGYFSLLTEVEEGRSSIAAAERLRSQGVDGLVVATARLADPLIAHLRRAGLPVVLVNRRDDSGAVPAVVSDDVLGMRLAVDHLVALGHTRHVHLAGPAALSTGALRRSGFLQALRRHRLRPAGLIDCSAYDLRAGIDAIERLAAQDLRFGAIVAANDLIAIGAIGELQRRGVRVPQDVSVVGHNDMPLVDHIAPPLTTVRIQHGEMGRRAALLLLDAMRGQHDAVATLVLRPELVVRGSTAPPAAR